MSKFKGNNNHFQPNGGLLQEAEAVMQIVNALKNEQFELYYQPYVHLVTGQVLGVEALIRWHHPKEGLLLPGQFLPLAETTNVIIDIEKWVLHRALDEIKQLNNLCNMNIKLSINISAIQFEQKTFYNKVMQALNRHQFPTHNLTLEITERFLLDENNIALMEAIRSEGTRISIDDFGTSYASLQYLMKYPIDEIKIDRSFITGIETNKRKLKIVKSLVSLGHDLGLTTIGEGVETVNQYKLLKSTGCKHAQGFLFNKPVPLSELVFLCKRTFSFE